MLSNGIRRGGYPGGESRRPRDWYRQAGPDYPTGAYRISETGAGGRYADLTASHRDGNDLWNLRFAKVGWCRFAGVGLDPPPRSSFFPESRLHPWLTPSCLLGSLSRDTRTHLPA